MESQRRPFIVIFTGYACCFCNVDDDDDDDEGGGSGGGNKTENVICLCQNGNYSTFAYEFNIFSLKTNGKMVSGRKPTGETDLYACIVLVSFICYT